MKSKNYVLGSLLLLTLILGGIGSPTQAQERSIFIYGQVIDSITGVGIEGVTVNLHSDLLFEGLIFDQNYLTNEKGYFYDTIVSNSFIERGEIVINAIYEGESNETSHYFRFNGRTDYFISSISKVSTDNPQPDLQANFFHTNENTEFNPANISFTDISISENEILGWFWDFGDGSISTLQNPKHAYTVEGNYKVSLTIQSTNSKNILVSSTITHPIHVFMNYEFSMWGQVFLGDFFIPQSPELGYVTLYKVEGDSAVEFDYQVLTHDGNEWAAYAFFALPLGEYLVKISLDPSSEYFENYFTTYYGDVQQSDDASPINLYSNMGNLDVHLLENTFVNNGEGQAVGEIIGGSKEGGISDAYIYLTDMDENPLLSINSNTQGGFGFKYLPYGDYKAYADITGLSCTPIIFSISEDFPVIGDLQFVVTDEGIVGGVNAIPEKINHFTQVFPNPCKDEIIIRSDLDEAASLSIYSVDGKQVYNQPFVNFSESISINTSTWERGVYFLKTIINNSVSINKLIKR